MKRRKDGLYKQSIVIGKDANGKQIRKYVYAKSTHELNDKMAELRVQYNHGNIVIDDITVNELCDIWVRIKLQGKSNAYVRNCMLFINNRIKPKLGFYRLKVVKPLYINELINGIASEGKLNTAKKTLQIVKSMFELAVDNNFLDKSPARIVPFPKYIKKEKRVLTKEEREIIDNSDNKYADFFRVLLYTGMRKGEISALTWKDIDFQNSTITVNKACDFTTNNPTLKSTKNGKDRIIPLLDKTRKILEPRVKSSTSKYVFSKQNGEMLSDVAIKRMLESFKKDTGLEFTLHELRHTFCTMLYYSGISSKKAQQIMGHSSLSVTLEIYTHLDEQKENATELLNNYLVGGN